MREIQLIQTSDTGVPATSQIFTVPNTNQQRLGFHFKYVTLIDRWMFDLYIDDVPALCGRRVVLDTNLLAPYALGVGALWAMDVEGAGDPPGLIPMTDGSIRLFHLSRLEQASLYVNQVLDPDNTTVGLS